MRKIQKWHRLFETNKMELSKFITDMLTMTKMQRTCTTASSPPRRAMAASTIKRATIIAELVTCLILVFAVFLYAGLFISLTCSTSTTCRTRSPGIPVPVSPGPATLYKLVILKMCMSMIAQTHILTVFNYAAKKVFSSISHNNIIIVYFWKSFGTVFFSTMILNLQHKIHLINVLIGTLSTFALQFEAGRNSCLTIHTE